MFRLKDIRLPVGEAAEEAVRLVLFGSHRSAARAVRIARGLPAPDGPVETARGPAVRTI